MSENTKKEWMLIRFPQGPFNGTMEIEVNGKNIVDKETVFDIINSSEDIDENCKLCDCGNSCCKR